MTKPELIICTTPAHFNSAKKLAKDYMDWLGLDLHYQGIDNEFENFDKMYGKPNGSFIYATIDGKIAGGVGTRFLETGVCEMKRLFVYEEFRGYNLGEIICYELLKISKELGYSKMRLDTIPKLNNAMQLYKNLGFYEISKYYNNPDKSVVYFELSL
ncbi:MAG: GNAT family N-acetyltransferase [Vicingaceae bacterium]|jgi:GNAT superfamily N-acetyltransferase